MWEEQLTSEKTDWLFVWESDTQSNWVHDKKEMYTCLLYNTLRSKYFFSSKYDHHDDDALDGIWNQTRYTTQNILRSKTCRHKGCKDSCLATLYRDDGDDDDGNK